MNPSWDHLKGLLDRLWDKDEKAEKEIGAMGKSGRKRISSSKCAMGRAQSVLLQDWRQVSVGKSLTLTEPTTPFERLHISTRLLLEAAAPLRIVRRLA